jgi:outer membrane autotransporter protein
MRRRPLVVAVLAVVSLSAQAQSITADGTQQTATTGATYNTTANGVAGYAFHALRGGRIDGQDVHIVTAGNQAYGVFAQNGGGLAGQVHLTGGDVTINGSSSALVAQGLGSRVTTDGTTIHAASNSAVGADVRDGATIDLRNSDIAMSGSSSVGIYATSASAEMRDGLIELAGTRSTAVRLSSGAGDTTEHKVVLDNVTMRVGLGSSATGFGILVQGDSANTHVEATNSIIDIYGATGKGVSIQGIGNSTVGPHGYLGNSTVTTWGNDAYTVSAMSGGSLETQDSTLVAHGERAIGALAIDGSHISLNGGSLTTYGTTGFGLYVAGNLDSIAADGVAVTATNAYGAYIGGGGHIDLTNSSVVAGQDAIVGSASAGNSVAVTGSHLESQHGYAVYGGSGSLDVVMDRSSASGVLGVLGANEVDPITFQGSGVVTLEARNQSTLSGNVDAASGNRIELTLANGSILSGVTREATGATINLGLDNTSVWKVAGDSVLNHLNNAGRVEFTAPVAGVYHTVKVNGNYTGNNGVVALNTHLNTGGALSNQSTDRLLIAGDVSGTTRVALTVDGAGANTNLALNNQSISSEGISLIQVAGKSTAGAFTLASDYVAAKDSPYQYRLFAFGPDQLDPRQSLIDGGTTWDYRLATAYVDKSGHVIPGVQPPDPPSEPGDSGNPAQPSGPAGTPDTPPAKPPAPPTPDSRPLLVPQGSSYLIAPQMMRNYGSMIVDNLNRRLGEVREGAFTGSDTQGEMFVRVIGNKGSYTSSQNWKSYGYDFDQYTDALQVGGTLLHLSDATNEWRFGVAGAFGSTRATPTTTALEHSQLNVTTRSYAATATWQNKDGWYADAVASYGRYDGSVGTSQRGRAATVHANAVDVSLEAGKSFALSGGWLIEPQLQVLSQHLGFNTPRDNDGVQVALASTHAWTGRAGVRLALPIVSGASVWTPYARLNVLRTWSGAPSVDLSGQSFDTGRAGGAFQVAAGASGDIGKNVSLYGEISAQRRIGGFGLSAVDATLGLRYRF